MGTTLVVIDLGICSSKNKMCVVFDSFLETRFCNSLVENSGRTTTFCRISVHPVEMNKYVTHSSKHEN